jgi:hypothetical protein
VKFYGEKGIIDVDNIAAILMSCLGAYQSKRAESR